MYGVYMIHASHVTCAIARLMRELWPMTSEGIRMIGGALARFGIRTSHLRLGPRTTLFA